jgi:hypothetical protein
VSRHEKKMSAYLGWIDMHGLKIIAREDQVQFVLRREDGSFLVSIAGNKDDHVRVVEAFESLIKAHLWLTKDDHHQHQYHNLEHHHLDALIDQHDSHEEGGHSEFHGHHSHTSEGGASHHERQDGTVTVTQEEKTEPAPSS